MSKDIHDADCGYTITGHIHNCSCGASDTPPSTELSKAIEEFTRWWHIRCGYARDHYKETNLLGKIILAAQQAERLSRELEHEQKRNSVIHYGLGLSIKEQDQLKSANDSLAKACAAFKTIGNKLLTIFKHPTKSVTYLEMDELEKALSSTAGQGYVKVEIPQHLLEQCCVCGDKAYRIYPVCSKHKSDNDVTAQIQSLTQANGELQKDKERLDWLDRNSGSFMQQYDNFDGDIRQAIDAAMLADK